MTRRDSLFHIFFAAIFGVVLFYLFRLLEPFLVPLFLAFILWILTLPLHDRLSATWPKGSPSVKAMVSMLVIGVMIIVPTVLVAVLFVNEIQDMVPRIQMWVNELRFWIQHPTWMQWAWVQKLQAAAGRFPGLPKPDLTDRISDLGSSALGLLTVAGKALAASTASIFFNVVMILLTLFFLFRDGRDWAAEALELIPMRREQKTRLVAVVRDTINNIVRGSVATAVFQTAVAVLGYWMVGAHSAFTMGVATGIASFLPAIGSALVWLPIALVFLFKGSVWKFIFVLFWGIVVISLSDNVVRTWVMGKSDDSISVFWLFLGLAGGIAVYGAIGLLIGPILIAVFPIFIDIYKETYLRRE